MTLDAYSITENYENGKTTWDIRLSYGNAYFARYGLSENEKEVEIENFKNRNIPKDAPDVDLEWL